MAKKEFNSFWGNMHLDEGSIEEPAAQTTPPAPDVDTPPADPQPDKTPAAPPAAPPSVDPIEPPAGEGEEYEFTEDDVSKAYTMIEEVLDIPDEEDFDSTPSGIADAVAYTIRKKEEEFINNLPGDVKGLYDHIQAGNDVGSYVGSNSTVTWDKFDLSNEDNQVQALTALLKSQGMSQEDIQEEVDDAKDLGKLDRKAATAVKTLSKQEKTASEAKATAAAKATADATESRQLEIAGVRKSIDDLEEIAGFKPDDAKKKEFQDYIFKVNPRTGKTQMQENMGSSDRRMTIAFLDFVNYTKADMEKSVKTDLTKTRRKKLTRYSDKGLQNTGVSVKGTPKKGGSKVAFPSIFGTQEIEVED